MTEAFGVGWGRGRNGGDFCGAPPKIIRVIRALEAAKADLQAKNKTLKVELRDLSRELAKVRRSRATAKETASSLRVEVKDYQQQLRTLKRAW